MKSLELDRLWQPGLLLLSVVVAVALLTLWLRRRVVRARMLARFRHARDVEDSAVQLLDERGYRVLGRRVPVRYSIWVDGVATPVDLQLDYLVERDGTQYVAEVKSGAVATSLAHAATRRQLIEYGIATQTSEVLLVDPERDTISTVRITSPASRVRRLSFTLVATYFFGALTGALVALWLRLQ